jgi:hypothetical protein
MNISIRTHITCHTYTISTLSLLSRCFFLRRRQFNDGFIDSVAVVNTNPLGLQQTHYHTYY